MKRRAAWRMWLLAASLTALPDAAAQSQADERLQAACDAYLLAAESAEGAPCRAYVEGFLDGLRQGIADPGLVRDQAQESWSDRAARVRLGRARLQALARRNAPVCMPDAVSVDEIIRGLQRELRVPRTGALRTPGAVLGQMLRQRYPCPD